MQPKKRTFLLGLFKLERLGEGVKVWALQNFNDKKRMS